jgi:hypothetical protein
MLYVGVKESVVPLECRYYVFKGGVVGVLVRLLALWTPIF